jgi:hypothetical protein
MFKFLGRALAGLFLTKEARHVVGHVVADRVGRVGKAGGAAGRDAAAEAAAEVRKLITPDRAELIRQAMQVRAAKQTILADLDDEARAKLVATAMKALLNEGRDKGRDKG